MKNLIEIIKSLIFLMVLLFIGIDFFAAGPPGPPGGGGPPGGCWPPSACIPIDGGISYLLVLGAIYGGKKLYDINKKGD